MGSNPIRELGITFYFLLRGKWAGRKMPLRAGNLIVREPALFFNFYMKKYVICLYTRRRFQMHKNNRRGFVIQGVVDEETIYGGGYKNLGKDFPPLNIDGSPNNLGPILFFISQKDALSVLSKMARRMGETLYGDEFSIEFDMQRTTFKVIETTLPVLKRSISPRDRVLTIADSSTKAPDPSSFIKKFKSPVLLDTHNAPNTLVVHCRRSEVKTIEVLAHKSNCSSVSANGTTAWSASSIHIRFDQPFNHPDDFAYFIKDLSKKFTLIERK